MNLHKGMIGGASARPFLKGAAPCCCRGALLSPKGAFSNLPPQKKNVGYFMMLVPSGSHPKCLLCVTYGKTVLNLK
jgi:hypothetical protein